MEYDFKFSNIILQFIPLYFSDANTIYIKSMWNTVAGNKNCNQLVL